MAKTTVAAAITFDGNTFEAALRDDNCVPVFQNETLLGIGRWSGRWKKIEADFEVPKGALALLSQRLRTEALGKHISARAAVRARPTKAEVTDLFRRFAGPGSVFPAGCTRWGHARLRQFYTVFVIHESEAMIFRNSILIGKARWVNPDLTNYAGEKIPVVVWLRLVRQLTDSA